MSSYRIVADVTGGKRGASREAVEEIIAAFESSVRARGLSVVVYGPIDRETGAGGTADTQWVPGVGHPHEGEPFGNYVDRMRREAERAGDPPMGYGYRQLHADPSQVYALRWGQSGRVTGYANAGRENGISGIPDPSTLVYIEHVESIAWARAQRWEVVAP